MTEDQNNRNLRNLNGREREIGIKVNDRCGRGGSAAVNKSSAGKVWLSHNQNFNNCDM